MSLITWNNLSSVSTVRLFMDPEARFVNFLVQAAEARNNVRINELKQIYIQKPAQQKNEILTMIRSEIIERENRINYPNNKGRSLEIGKIYNYTLKTLINFYNNFSANKYQTTANIDLSE